MEHSLRLSLRAQQMTALLSSRLLELAAANRQEFATRDTIHHYSDDVERLQDSALRTDGVHGRWLPSPEWHCQLNGYCVEAFWKSVRHQWLYLSNLSDIATVRRLTKFYVQQHNEVMPHAAFKGQTPDEVYSGKGEGVLIELAKVRERAREERLKANRELECGKCPVKGKK